MSEQAQGDKNTKNIAYIVTKKFHSKHIENLIHEFGNLQIPVQMHNDYDGLGVPLDRRYFVVVDNSEGAVSLGSWFTSLLLFIVGYPSKGKNKKNHYCANPKQVIEKYNVFNALPEFIKRNYLSSSITSKSVLKSARTFSQSKANSESSTQTKRLQQMNQKSLLKKKINEASQKSKLLMFFSQSDLIYNKWILKIAASNAKKYQIVESVQDLKLFLSVCRNKDNFLLITTKEYIINRIEQADIPIIIYNKDNEKIQSSSKIIATCYSHKQIIYKLRQIGFQVVSLKDIDKSIVRYRNPLDKNKIKQNKKILWGNEKGEENGDNQKGNKKSQISESQYYIKVNNEPVNQENMTASAPINCSFSSITKPESPSVRQDRSITENREKKRISIDNGVPPPPPHGEGTKRCLSESQRLLSSLKGPIIFTTHKNVNKAVKQFKKKQQDMLDQKNSYITPVPLVQTLPFPILQQPITTNADLISPEIKIQRIKRVRSLITQNKRSSEYSTKQIPINYVDLAERNKQKNVVTQAQSQKNKQGLTNLHQVSISLSLGKQILKQSKVSSALKVKDEKTLNLLPIVESEKIYQRQKSSQSSKKSIIKKMDMFNLNDEKQNNSVLELNRKMSDSTKSNSHSIKYKMQLMDIQQSFLRKRNEAYSKIYQSRKIVSQNCLDYALLWKQFNSNIEVSKNVILEEFRKKKFNHFSFYTPEQLAISLYNQKQPNLLLFLDEVDISNYFSAIQATLKNRNIVLIYIFEKQNRIKKEFIQKIKGILRPQSNQKAKVIIKPVRSTEYSDENTQIAKQICSWFL